MALNIKGFPNRGDKALTASTYSYIDSDGALHTGVYAEPVMVTAEADLAKLDVVPGTMAYTAGFRKMWQIGADGQWEPMGAGEETPADAEEE